MEKVRVALVNTVECLEKELGMCELTCSDARVQFLSQEELKDETLKDLADYIKYLLTAHEMNEWPARN